MENLPLIRFALKTKCKDIKITTELMKQSIITNLSQTSFCNLHTVATSSGLWENVKLHKINVYVQKMAPLKLCR